MEEKKIRLLRAEEIECRVGTINEKGLTLLLYKDARVDMKLLDEAFGPENWQRSHTMIGGNLYCTVSVWDEQKAQWISKADVGTESYTEKEKGQASDSFKRACVLWGIGRELYKAPFIWIPASKANIQSRGEKYYTYDKFQVRSISYNENREICALLILNRDGRVVYRFGNPGGAETEGVQYPQDGTNYGETGQGAIHSGGAAQTTPEGSERIEAVSRELVRTGVALDTVLKRYGVGSIDEMSEENYRNAMNCLRKTKSRKAA